MKLEGNIVECLDDKVRVLIELRETGERILCVFPPEIWPQESPPEEGQICVFELGQEPKVTNVLPAPPRRMPVQNDSIADAQDVLGFAPGDKVTVVISSISTPQARTDVRHNLGWGEGLALTRITSALSACGIAPNRVTYVFPEQQIDNPELALADTHVIFLGSTRSNSVLRDHFWPTIKKDLPVSIPESGHARLVIDFENGPKEWLFDDLNAHPKDASSAPHESIHIVDPFFVAVVANPYDKKNYHRCVLICGAGTFGTGYASVVVTARESISKIADAICSNKNPEPPHWWTAWQVDMKGRFNKNYDRVTYLAGSMGHLDCSLPWAVTSPTIWSDEEDEGDDVIRQTLSKYGRES